MGAAKDITGWERLSLQLRVALLFVYFALGGAVVTLVIHRARADDPGSRR